MKSGEPGYVKVSLVSDRCEPVYIYTIICNNILDDLGSWFCGVGRYFSVTCVCIELGVYFTVKPYVRCFTRKQLRE